MDDIDLDAAISDGSSSLDLNLTVANGYSVPRSGIGVGNRTWIKETAESPYVHDEYVIGQKLGPQKAPLIVRVRASTTSLLFTRIAALIAAVEQVTWTLTLTIDGQDVSWACRTADSALGDSGVLDELALMRHEQLVRLTIPRHPVPLAGPF